LRFAVEEPLRVAAAKPFLAAERGAALAQAVKDNKPAAGLVARRPVAAKIPG
jgi:hypothetical protein